MKKIKRIKIIPDRIFHKLWDLAGKYDNADEYVKSVINDAKTFNYKNYDLDYVEASEVLARIYSCRYMKLKDICDRMKVKKSEISHTFCIPIRTVEEWYTGNNKFPGYICLMMLKYYYLLYLGKYVRLESDIWHDGARPSVYIKRVKNTDETDNKEKADISSTIDSSLANRNKDDNTPFEMYEDYLGSDDYEKYLDQLIASTKKNKDKKKPEYENILLDTNYLDERMRKK